MDASRRRWALTAVALATFMTYLDNNIINVAMPTIQRQLHLSVAGLEWVVSAYILVFAGSIFTAGSLAAGLAGDVDVLVVSRAVQGLGAALVTPTTLAVISASFTDPRERNAAVGAWSTVGALAPRVQPGQREPIPSPAVLRRQVTAHRPNQQPLRRRREAQRRVTARRN